MRCESTWVCRGWKVVVHPHTHYKNSLLQRLPLLASQDKLHRKTIFWIQHTASFQLRPLSRVSFFCRLRRERNCSPSMSSLKNTSMFLEGELGQVSPQYANWTSQSSFATFDIDQKIVGLLLKTKSKHKSNPISQILRLSRVHSLQLSSSLNISSDSTHVVMQVQNQQ